MKLRPPAAARIAALIGSVSLLAGARAEPTLLNAFENSEVTTDFTLSFPSLGINSTSNVFYTRFKLEIDEAAGTARFVDYNQQIESLTLPLGITTGRIGVRINKSDGTYDAATRTFETVDEYEITFENDLSFFGFTSPVLFPAVSQGTVTGGAAAARNVRMVWGGEGQFENADNPAEPFIYTYSCRVDTVIGPESETPPLPTANDCGSGLFSFFGLATMSLTFVGLRTSGRRRRRA